MSGNVGMSGNAGMSWICNEDDRYSRLIIGCAIKVHRVLGPGFKEEVYKQAMKVEFRRRDIPFETEKEVTVYYEGFKVGRHVLDLIVAQEIVVELKAAKMLTAAHYAQTRSYMRATNTQFGLLINFAGSRADYRHISTASPHSQDKSSGSTTS